MIRDKPRAEIVDDTNCCARDKLTKLLPGRYRNVSAVRIADEHRSTSVQPGRVDRNRQCQRVLHDNRKRLMMTDVVRKNQVATYLIENRATG